jgi:hypothetical protein
MAVERREASDRACGGGRGEHNPLTRRKKQFRFSAESEMALLRSVCALTPWEAAHGKTQAIWEETAKTLRVSGLDVDGKRAKAKFDALINGWRDRVAMEERASGVDVE